MRQILIQRARARRAAKRDGDRERVTLHDTRIGASGVDASFAPAVGPAPGDVDVLALDEALTRLAAFDPEQARIVELRYFGGLTVEETADAVGVSPATVKRQ